MAILGAKKNTVKAKATKKPAKKAEVAVVTAVSAKENLGELASILIRPRITEKATVQNEKGVYVFEVHAKANKKDVANAIFENYKVHPVAVNITKIPAKAVFVRGKVGKKAAIKKASVYLKEGDKIEIV